MSSSTGGGNTWGLSHEARNLQWLLGNFVREVPGVYSVTVVSSDGLLLLASDPGIAELRDRMEVRDGQPGRPVADLATVVSGIASLTQGAAQLMEAGKVRQTVVTMDHSSVFVMSISDGSLLGVHTAADCDMSVVGYHMALFLGRAGHVLTPELRAELRQAIEASGR
jgi:predicted regulator of Ras-like GTPase activity (Roadblock/LC7/MglB family)